MMLFGLMGAPAPAQTEQLPASTASSADDGSSPAAAEEQRQTEEQRPTEEIVVTAARRQRLRSEVPVSVTVISGADLEQTAALSLDDALRTVAGVGLPGQSSLVSHPTSQSISLRGLGRSRALVLLDGIPLNDGFGGWINWSKIPLRNIDRVEIVRGGGSSLYGTYAMGGVINVVTRPTEDRSVLLNASYGSQQTSRVDLYGSERFGDTTVALQYSHFDTAGYKVVPNGERGSIDRKADSRNHNLSVSANHAFSPDVDLSVRGTLFRERRNTGTPLADNRRDVMDFAARLRAEHESAGELQVSLFGELQDFDNFNSSVLPGRQSETLALTQDVPSGQVGTSTQWSRGFEFWAAHLLAGADFRHIEGKNDETIIDIVGVTPGDVESKGKQQALGAFAELEIHPWPALEVLTSVRVDYWRNFDGRRTDQVGNRTHFSDKSELEISPRLSLRYALHESLALRGAVYRAFRAPNLNELYRGFFAGNTPFNPNPGLGPEILKIGGELGFDVVRGPLSLRATGFWNELEDTIAFVTVTPWPNLSFRRDNVAETRSRGVEVELELEIFEALTLTPSYTYLDSTIEKFDPDPSREGNQLPNVPEHTFAFSVRYDRPRWLTLSVRGRYLSRRYADDRHTERLESHFVLDLSASRTFFENWEVYVQASNIFDKTYRAGATGRLGALGAPAQVWGGVRYAW
jgi:outer membrane cobalamin receptor